MTEHDAFEARFARAYRRYLDEVPTDVDALAVARAVATQRRLGFTARRWVPVLGAGVVAVLLGGALLSGVFSSPPTDELMPGAATSAPSPEAVPTTEPALGSITLEVMGLVGMEGLDLVGHVTHWVLATDEPQSLPDWDIIHLPIDASPFSASGHVEVLAGPHGLLVFAGEPTCDFGYDPLCGNPVAGDEVAKDPDHGCELDFDLQPGEHIRIRLSGLPPWAWAAGALPPCQVESWTRARAR
jgi:hypothetical protein